MLKRRIVLISLITLFLSGCATDSGSETKATESKPIVKSGWDCKTDQDGIGENFGCFSSSNGYIDGVYWTMTLMCTSDLVSKHSIVGFNSKGENVIWPIGEIKLAKVRIDAQPLEEWKVTSKASGQALIFTDSERITSSNADSSESRKTWDLLSDLAGAKTFGFKASDMDGYIQSYQFNVSDSVPIAAKFSALGCSGGRN